MAWYGGIGYLWNRFPACGPWQVSAEFMALLHFWRDNREAVLGQTIQQVVSNAGDGNLRDHSPASVELRMFFGEVPAKYLFSYARQCLDTPFPKSGAVLQDVVNELGRRLDFEVENGLYQGRRNAIGFDGVWKAAGQTELVVEVKTTDAYTFALETAHEYRESLIGQGHLGRSSSILIVVGRDDTGALEAQVRGSRFAWDIRLISVESLIKLVQTRDKADSTATVQQIHQILRPFEYTRVDRIIDILLATASDVEDQQDESVEPASAETGQEETAARNREKTGRALIEEIKDRAVAGFSKLKGVEFLRRGRSYFWSSDRRLRVCCTVSKRYEKDYQPYWYAYHPKWDEFLRDGEGYLIFVCVDREFAFAVPRQWFAENANDLSVSERDGSRAYWHIPMTTLEDGTLAINLTRAGRKYSLEPHRFPLAPSSARTPSGTQ